MTMRPCGGSLTTCEARPPTWAWSTVASVCDELESGVSDEALARLERAIADVRVELLA